MPDTSVNTSSFVLPVANWYIVSRFVASGRSGISHSSARKLSVLHRFTYSTASRVSVAGAADTHYRALQDKTAKHALASMQPNAAGIKLLDASGVSSIWNHKCKDTSASQASDQHFAALMMSSNTSQCPATLSLAVRLHI
eukprot:GHRR01028281.1.p2 GENE.GHRR01028281.1~~GHRR01028281.1.p2  ORF type:complete len:140 (-),score=33.35 GHRR01028281.1:51-470(-)